MAQSGSLGRILGTTGVKVAMKPQRTLKQVLVRPKDKVTDGEKSGVVYRINCNECDASYIGQTGRNFRVRLGEHKRATRNGKIEESGVAEHVHKTGHNIDWEANIIDQDQNERRRLVIEAAHIRMNRPSMNRDTGLELSRAYDYICKGRGIANSTLQEGEDH